MCLIIYVENNNRNIVRFIKDNYNLIKVFSFCEVHTRS